MIKALIENRTYYTAKTFANIYMAFVLWLSFSHLTALFTGWGSKQAWVAPLLVDSLMILGRMIRHISKNMFWLGASLQIFGAAASLTGNVLAGDSKGDRIIGAGVIVFFLIVEWVSEVTKPARTFTEIMAAQKKAARDAARRQAQAQAKKDADAKRAEQAAARRKAAAAKKAEQQIDMQTATAVFDTTVAPISPAPVSYGMADDTRGYV